jgi:hypothetical protein
VARREPNRDAGVLFSFFLARPDREGTRRSTGERAGPIPSRGEALHTALRVRRPFRLRDHIDGEQSAMLDTVAQPSPAPFLRAPMEESVLASGREMTGGRVPTAGSRLRPPRRPVRRSMVRTRWGGLGLAAPRLRRPCVYEDTNGRVEQADIFFNTRYALGVFERCAGNGTYEVGNVATHEVGTSSASTTCPTRAERRRRTRALLAMRS